MNEWMNEWMNVISNCNSRKYYHIKYIILYIYYIIILNSRFSLCGYVNSLHGYSWQDITKDCNNKYLFPEARNVLCALVSYIGLSLTSVAIFEEMLKNPRHRDRL